MTELTSASIQSDDLEKQPAPASPPATPKATFRAVLRQVLLDWFTTKDVQENPTLTYVWTADQFGHFSLGFLPAYLIAWIVTSFTEVNSGVLVGIAAAIFCLWIVKELWDYRSEVKRATAAQSDFPFNSREIWWNVVTAWIFFAMGSLIAALSLIRPSYPLYGLVVLLPVTVGVSWWWLRRKLTFQQAGLPYLYRLANFPNNIAGDDQTRQRAIGFVQQIADPAQTGRKHLIITGKINSGKTPLAVGVGTEFAFRTGIGRYTSLTKLLELHDKQKAAAKNDVADSAVSIWKEPVEEKEFNDGRNLWPWEAAQLLIIDDVDRALGVMPKGASSDECLDELKRKLTTDYGDLLQKLTFIPRVVWVLSDQLHADKFKQLVESLAQAYKAPPMQIEIVRLEKTMEEARAQKAMLMKPQS
jgi:hypothetical protein